MKRVSSFVASIAVALSLVALCGCVGPLNELAPGSTSSGSTSMTIRTTATATQGVLTVGVDYDTAPFAGTDSNGNLMGLDVDMAAALAQQLGCQVKFVNVDSDTMDAALSSGQIDIAMNVAATDYSPTVVTTIGPYLTDGPAFFQTQATASSGSTNGSATKIPDGSKVAVQSGSVAESQVSEEYDSLQITRTSTLADAFDALAAGSVDYVAADALVGSYVALDYSGISLRSVVDSVAGMYIGVSPSKSQLASDVNNALMEIENTGILEVTESKWVGTPPVLPLPVDQATYVTK